MVHISTGQLGRIGGGPEEVGQFARQSRDNLVGNFSGDSHSHRLASESQAGLLRDRDHLRRDTFTALG